MTIEELLHHLEPDTSLTVLNSPFFFTGKARIVLDGGDTRVWLYGEDGDVLAVSPDAEEIVMFEAIDTDIEPQGGMVLYQGNEFEFSYEDNGAVTETEGAVGIEEGDSYGINDYESDAGEIVRLITNHNTGDQQALFGKIVVEEDILPAA